jgi:two-component system sensor histidine kinase ChiS
MSLPDSYILLVDDEPENLLLMTEILETEGYEVRQAESGSKALELVEEAAPQLILLDIMMPDMDGFEVCRRIRHDPQNATIPVLFLTALSDDDSLLQSIEVMGDDYLTKPVNINLVLKKIMSTLKLLEIRDTVHQKQLVQKNKEVEDIHDKYCRQMTAAWTISEAMTEKFHSFVPKQFLDRVAPKGLDSIKIGSSFESEMTILFCDIREFTAIAEFQTAQDTYRWLNAFFENVNDAVMQNNGFIDKYLGDAVMAVFDREAAHAVDALNAVTQVCHALETFNRDRHQFELQDPINIGAGVHSGTGLIGTVGTNQRMDTTVVGDVVNTASRLEDMTKIYQCPVIVSEDVIRFLPDDHAFRFRRLDQVKPRGKRTALDIYEFLSCSTALNKPARR